MKEELSSIESQVSGVGAASQPPLHLWNPPLSGDIDIRIAADGHWFHEGEQIRRDALVRLFASILRRESDGEYYLVTPVEKWRLTVELHPLIVTDISPQSSEVSALLLATLNTGRQFQVGEDYPLSLEPQRSGVAVLELSYGLTALVSRPAWYRLVDLASEERGMAVVTSGSYTFALGPLD